MQLYVEEELSPI